MVSDEAIVLPPELTGLAQSLRFGDAMKEEGSPNMLWPLIFPPSTQMRLVGKKRSFQQMNKRKRMSLASMFVMNRMADLLDK